MKRLILWLGILLTAITIPSITTQATETENMNKVTVHLKHQSLSETGTTFSIFGLTSEQYTEALNQKIETSVDKTNRWLGQKEIVKEQEIWVSSSNEAVFSLSKYDVNSTLKYYVILQNQPEMDATNDPSTNTTYESMPIFVSLDSDVDGELFIETKPINIETSIYFFKYSAGTIQKPLEGAEFAFYRLTSTNKKEYLMQVNPITWDDKVTADQATQFKSNKIGLVELPNVSLPIGTYYFEETKAPVGFSMTDNSKKVPVTILEEQEAKKVTVNQETLNKKQAGLLSQNVLANATPKVFNNPVSEKISQPVTSKNEPLRKGFLPQTGESLMTFTSLGLIMMIVAFGLMKRGKENE